MDIRNDGGSVTGRRVAADCPVRMAIIIPQARDDMRYCKVIVIAAALACAFHYLPGLNRVSSGFAIILCSVIAAAVGAWLYPLEIEQEER